MDETIKEWLIQLYSKELWEVKGTIENEELWELGYNGNETNPHTENISKLREYLEILNEKLEELK